VGKGKIFLVGLGPGAADQMTGRARRAIAKSEVVVGYAKYLDLVKDLLDGKEVIRKGMTQEVDRCVAACDRAREGKAVALVSSGDSGVYGMAGLTFEVLLRNSWTPEDGIGVEVIPGITALSACASLVGAPLSHDFCAISLSDLLTPWPAISRRIEAAARGDFVVALYNPKSGRRQRQLLEARNILLRHRLADTPVAIVDAAYRDRQAAKLSTLDAMTDYEIGMLSTVLVGNSSTYVRKGLMITPRGYSHKYDGLTGELKDGERSGRSLSMGLEGWKACVRRYLRETPSVSLQDAARNFDVPPGQILLAISEAESSESGNRFAALVIPGAEAAVLDAVREWGRIQILLAGGTETLCVVRMNGDALFRHGERIYADSGDLSLSIDRARLSRAWFVSWDTESRGVHFVDAAGNSVFEIDLIKHGGRFDPSGLESYVNARSRLVGGAQGR